MPFPRLKVRHAGSFGSCQRESSVTDSETGIVTTVMVDCNKPLPAAEMFEISNMVKAGVHLDEVNTKILGSGVDTEALTEAVQTAVKSTRKTTKKEEVKSNED